MIPKWTSKMVLKMFFSSAEVKCILRVSDTLALKI